MIYHPELLILFRLVLAHLLADFIFQPVAWSNSKKRKRYRSGALYFHALIAAVTAYLFAGIWTNWWLPAAVFFAHLLTDVRRFYQSAKLKYLLADQVFHLLVLVLLWLALFNKWQEALVILYSLVNNAHLILTITAYLLVTWPLGTLIGIATEKWRAEADVNREGLDKAGMWIGLLERFLILTFILVQQYTAIGFLIAAKSVLRFSDKENTQKKTEYVLIGTLMSFSASFVIGLLAEYLGRVI